MTNHKRFLDEVKQVISNVHSMVHGPRNVNTIGISDMLPIFSTNSNLDVNGQSYESFSGLVKTVFKRRLQSSTNNSIRSLITSDGQFKHSNTLRILFMYNGTVQRLIII